MVFPLLLFVTLKSLARKDITLLISDNCDSVLSTFDTASNNAFLFITSLKSDKASIILALELVSMISKLLFNLLIKLFKFISIKLITF